MVSGHQTYTIMPESAKNYKDAGSLKQKRQAKNGATGGLSAKTLMIRFGISKSIAKKDFLPR